MQPVLILGGYGNFGKRIATALTLDGIPVIIAGRTTEKAKRLVQELPENLATAAIFDVFSGLEQELERLKPVVVINTCGPFQSSDYSVAEICIRRGVHYVDLADGRDFVTGITALNTQAKAQGVSVISGASTVPGLSSAVLEHFRNEFSEIDDLKYGISPGQKAERGLATTEGILSYVGKRLKPFAAAQKKAYGWQDIYHQRYPHLGKRWMANCDVPDLELLPERYGIKSIRFSAGMELSLVHLGLWSLSWLVRIGLPINLPRFAKPLLKASGLFDRFGTANGGMHVIMTGKDNAGGPYTRKWFIIAKDGDGPQIPTIPAIVLAKDLARGERLSTGAQPCVGLVTLDRYMEELRAFSIQQYEYAWQCDLVSLIAE